MNFDEMINAAKGEIENSWDKMVATGVPALQLSVQNQAIDWLNSQKAATENELDDNMKKMLEEGDGGPLSDAIKKSGMNVSLEKYGPQILIGVGVLLIGGYLLFKK